MSAVVSGRGDPVAVFAASLRQLFAAAGAPPVTQIAREIGVSAGTVSNWRTGRHLPAEFTVIEPLLVLLIDRAHQRQRANPNSGVDASLDGESGEDLDPTVDMDTAVGAVAGGGVLSVRQWQGLFAAAVGAQVVGPALDQIAVAAEQWAADAGPEQLAVARTVLLDCVEVTAAGYAAARWSLLPADDAAGDDLTARVVEVLTGLGVLTPPPHTAADGAESGVVLVDVQVLNAWPRLSRWVRAAWGELGARSSLEQDARRWHAAGCPAELLYDYRRLELAADALVALGHRATTTAPDSAAITGAGFRFGTARAADVPAAVVPFWTASQSAALYRLRVDQIIMALLITLSVAVLGLGFALAAVTA